MALEAIGLGAMNLDHLYRVERVLVEGEVAVERFLLAPGGSAANTIYGLAKLGVATGFAGAVGDDEAGRLLVKDFQSVGTDVTHVKVKRAKTGSVLCLSDREGQRALYVSPGANGLLGWEDLDPDYFTQVQIVHLSSFLGEEQLGVQKRLVANLPPSVRVSFSPGPLYAARGLEALSPLLQRTHILFLNHDEVRELTGEEFKKGARRFLEQGCRIVVVTLGRGEAGVTSYVSDGEEEHEIEGGAKRVEDATGAGDAFAAGFLYGLLRGKGLRERALLGETMSAFCLSEIGTRAGLPALPELLQRYHELYGIPF